MLQLWFGVSRIHLPPLQFRLLACECLPAGVLAAACVPAFQWCFLQRSAAEKVLKAFQENPDAWTRVDTILEKGKTQQTKFFALQVMTTDLGSDQVWWQQRRMLLLVRPAAALNWGNNNRIQSSSSIPARVGRFRVAVHS